MADNQTKKLISIRERRLALLQEKQAFKGINTEPEILMEIAQIEQEIEQLRAQHQREVVRDVSLQQEQPTPAPGLILLIGPGHIFQDPRNQSALDAIDFHRGALRCCWLIGSADLLAVAYEIRDFCNQRRIQAFTWQIGNPYSGVQETFELVDWIYTQDVPIKGLREDEVIADITGATKPMSAGMLFACGIGRPMQYMVRQKEGPSLPILLRYTQRVTDA